MLFPTLLCSVLLAINVSENEGPNSSRATYSVLLEKMASRDGRCVSALKQRRVDPSNDGRPSSTSTRRPSTTRADCLEEWELPCGRPSAPGPASALNGPPGRMHNVSLYRPNMSAVDAEIDDIRRTVLSVINNTMAELYHRHRAIVQARLDELDNRSCDQLVSDTTSSSPMRDVVTLLLTTIQQVPAKLKQLRLLRGRYRAEDWSRLNASLTSVKSKTIRVLCPLHESLAAAMDPERRRLPDCGTDPVPPPVTLTASSILQPANVMLLDGLVEMTKSLRVAQCVARAHAQR